MEEYLEMIDQAISLKMEVMEKMRTNVNLMRVEFRDRKR